jgi:hypothetical protein
MSALKKEVAVFEPNFSLKKKIGNINISSILNEKVIAKAEMVIESSSDFLKKDIASEIDQINSIISASEGMSINSLNKIIPLAFSVKSHAGLCGYPLISAMAKSLYLFCEAREQIDAPLTKQEQEIITWHGQTITTIFQKNITQGEGSEFGKGLLSELGNIKEKFTNKY